MKVLKRDLVSFSGNEETTDTSDENDKMAQFESFETGKLAAIVSDARMR